MPAILIIEEKRSFGESPHRHGRNVEIITSKDLQQLPVQTVSEALQYLSGVDLRQRGPIGAQADITMLGGTFEQVLVLVNGIPMRDPQTGHHQMNLPVDLNMIERIEIIKGSAARIYGANALAGAINIITKDPASEKAYVQTYSASPFVNDTANGDLYYAAGARAAIGFKAGNSSHRLDIGYQNTNGYRYNSANEQSRINYLGRIQLSPSSKFNIMAGTLDNAFGANQFYAPAVDKNATERVRTSYGAVRFDHYRNGWRFNPLAYWRYNHDDYNLGAFNYRNNHFTTTAGAEFHAAKNVGKYTFGGGMEFRSEIIRSNNLGKHERYYYAGYTEIRRVFENDAQITAGANIQYNTDFGWNIYPGIEFNTPVLYDIRLFGSAGLANRLPTYTDLYYSDRATVGNPSLRPETAFTYEAGLRKTLNFLRLQASVFNRDMQNFIDFTRSSPPALFAPQNFQRVTVRGAEFSGQAQTKKPNDRSVYVSSIRMTYTYLDASIGKTDVESRYALEHLSHQFNTQVYIQTGKKISHTLSGRYLERFTGEEYAVFDYRIKFDSGKWSIFGDVSNLLDRPYTEIGFIPMPGRWYRVGVDFSIK